VDDQLRDENPDDTEQDDDLHDADEYADDADENAVIQHAYTDHPNSKAYRSADLIAAIYHATPHSRAAQVVFSDLGTPKSR
jgi:hypothetical protein